MLQNTSNHISAVQSFSVRLETLSWYALRIRPNHERLSAAALGAKGYEQYLPVFRSRRRWSDRVIDIEQPLFPGYIFCRFDAKKRLPILTSPGVVSVVGFGNEPVPIPESEIQAVQAILRSGLGAEPCPFLREGQRIRIRRGAFEGMEGILLKKKSEWRIVVSISLLQRSVSVEIDRHEIVTL
jgi:transcription antitermination factor NusG